MTDRTIPALAATLILVAVTGVLTLSPASGPPAGVPGLDKLYHAIAFAALALPLAWARPGWIWPVALLLAVYGGLIEIIQPYVGRGREFADWIADLAGIAFGSVLGIWLARIGKR